MATDDVAWSAPPGRWYRSGVVLVLAAAAVSGWVALSLATHPSVVVRFDYSGNAAADDVRIADGITIEITRELARIEGLDVRAAVILSTHGNQPGDTRTVGMERGARLVLQGSVLIEAGVVRHIHASLVSIHSGVVWSGSFVPENNDIFAVHGAIAAAVADTLGLAWPGRGRHSIDPLLQRQFLRARALQADRGNLSRPEAVDLFERITSQASSFVPAVAALATTLGGNLSIAGWPSLDPRMAAAARAAYEADPQLAEANVAMGLLSARICQWTRADAFFVEALRLDQSVTAAYTDYVISTLLPLGRITEALEVLRNALAADPGSVDVRRTLAYVHLQNNDYDGAIETTRWVIKHHPDQEYADQSHGRALYLSRRFEEALEWFGSREGQWGHRGYVLALMGREDEARALAEAHPNEPARQLLIYAGLNDLERAFEAFRRTAIDNPWRALVWMSWPEIEHVLRGDPRAAAIRTQLLRRTAEGGCAVSSLDARAVSASNPSGV